MLEEDWKKAIRGQIALNHNTNLFYVDFPTNARLLPDFIRAIQEAASTSPAEQSRMVEFAAHSTVKVLYSKNQFISIPDTLFEELKSLYSETLRLTALGCGEEELIRSHQERLSLWVRQLYPQRHRMALRQNREIGTVTCAEYSPELIERAYQIDLRYLDEPILDIGCGENGSLVKRLISLNKQAEGFDRGVGKDADAIKAGDWLTYAYGSGRWGTVFANMSFSNHSIYHQSEKTEFSEEYHAVYQAICRSLRIGGRFYYAPSLETDEEALDRLAYRVNHEYSSGVKVSVVSRMG